MDISIDLDRLYRSIWEQTTELKYRRKTPAWVLLSPLTMYELQRTSTDWIYLGMPKTAKETPIVMIMGIPTKPLSWMPDGIVVVTDNFVEESPSPTWKAFTTDSLYRAFEDYKIKVADWPPTEFTTTTTVPSFYFFDSADVKAATASGTFTLFEGHPKEPSKAVVESQEPDPESIYGKALARARARIPYKKAEK